MGGSDSPPPTIIIEDDVEQDTGLQNNLPKSSKIQDWQLVAIIGLIMFIIGAGLCASGDTSGFKWLFFGILILLFSGIILAFKKWGMKIFITIFIPGMVIFFVLDYIISGQPFF